MLTKVRKVIDPDGKDARDGQGVSVIFFCRREPGGLRVRAALNPVFLTIMTYAVYHSHGWQTCLLRRFVR